MHAYAYADIACLDMRSVHVYELGMPYSYASLINMSSCTNRVLVWVCLAVYWSICSAHKIINVCACVGDNHKCACVHVNVYVCISLQLLFWSSPHLYCVHACAYADMACLHTNRFSCMSSACDIATHHWLKCLVVQAQTKLDQVLFEPLIK